MCSAPVEMLERTASPHAAATGKFLQLQLAVSSTRASASGGHKNRKPAGNRIHMERVLCHFFQNRFLRLTDDALTY
jgi:hypothetical protein